MVATLYSLCWVMIMMTMNQIHEVHGFRLAEARNRSRLTISLSQMKTIGDSLGNIKSRRSVLKDCCIFLTGSACLVAGPDMQATAAAAPKSSTSTDPVEALRSARTTLQTLLDNWEKAVIDCTFADVPRELLEQKNKEQLLEKASTFALFDKSVSVETCKTTNRIVRDYLGATGKGPVVGLEKQMKTALERVNPDYLEDYVAQIEMIEQTLAKARSLSYTAGVADFSSVNNFEKDQVKEVLANNSNLEQSRLCVEQIVDGLVKIEAMFED